MAHRIPFLATRSRVADQRRRATAATLSLARGALDVCEGLLRPLLLIAIRLWLARVFSAYGLEAIMAADGAVRIDSGLAALALACSALLVVGLFTRLAALPIAAMSFLADDGASGHILCGLLALTLVVHGPGPLSLDAFLGPGARHSALPLARLPARISARVERIGAPPLALALRLWTALQFALTAAAALPGAEAAAPGPGWVAQATAQATTLSPLEAGAAQAGALFAASLLLMLGLGARLAAAVLLGATLVMLAAPAGAPQHLLLALVLGHLVVSGPGAIALDAPLDRWLRRRSPAYDGRLGFDLETCPQVVIVGAGFGGLAAAKALSKAQVRVTVVDRHNYHLFQPLLYQVATAGLTPSDIAVPIRSALAEQRNARILLGEVRGVDTTAREAVLSDRRLRYDALILATGARHAYFGRDDWETFAPGLKKIDDATDIRRRVLLAFERAEAAEDPVARARLMTFVVVGAGPTGVEMAGAVAELAREGLARDFARIDPASARVLLVQSGDRVLPGFAASLSDRAQRALEEIGVDVRVGSRVTEIDRTGVVVGGERIDAGAVIWAAGVRASRAARWLGVEADRAGRVIVGRDLAAPGLPDIFVVGDTAAMHSADGTVVPGLAPAAKQSGAYAARVIAARYAGRPAPKPFCYRHGGNLATIGRDAAVADFGWLRLSGRPAWWLWGAVHVFFLLGARNRAGVMLSWAWCYFSYRRAARLITGHVDHDAEGETVGKSG